MSKSTAIAAVISSVILGGAVVTASLISQGLLFAKEPVQPKENIITTTVGHVNLGKVYSERRQMDIALTIVDDSGKEQSIFRLSGVDPKDFDSQVKDKVAAFTDSVNKDRSAQGKKPIEFDQMALIRDSKISVRTYISYTAQNVSNYELTIEQKEDTLPENSAIYGAVVGFARKIAVSSAPGLAENMFISEPTGSPQ